MASNESEWQHHDPDAAFGAAVPGGSPTSPLVLLPPESPKGTRTTTFASIEELHPGMKDGDSLSVDPVEPVRSRRLSTASNRLRTAIVATRRLSQGRLSRPQACQQCAQLQLTFESFVIEDDTRSTQVQGPNFYGKRAMGSYDDILRRSKECELCQLLLKSWDLNSTSSETVPVDSDAICELFWRVDGREHVSSAQGTVPHTIKRTRRLAIEWRSKTAKHDLSYIVLVAPDGRFLADGTVNPQGERVGRSTFFLGRKLTSLEVANTQLVRNWLQLCRENHSECAIDHRNSKFQELLDEPSFSIVDVENMCLDKLPDGEEYVALSYTWGLPSESATTERENDDHTGDPNVDLDANEEYSAPSSAGDESVNHANGSGPDESVGGQKPCEGENPPKSRFLTTSKNARSLEQPDGVGKVLENMPVAIQNAIALTKHLGFKYIWIDSLCIIQDSSDSWKINARLMDVVYGNADLTICAADGNGADVGLEALYAPSGGANQRYHRPATEQQVTVKYPTYGTEEGTLELMLSWPSESYVACSRWNRRAWTFQERMISPRCLICVNKRVYFQCRTTTMSEDIYSDVKTAKGTAGWSAELDGAPARTLKRLRTDPIGVYKVCLRMYTSRELTVEQDILSAFAGIGNVICQHLTPPQIKDEEDRALLFGLPASHFDFALLWQPQEAPERRSLPNAIFPSWSWSGWRCQTGMSYRKAAVAGPEINLHEWLMRHTWITYYVRDANGHLRLVWDPASFKHGEASEEERWRGYDTPSSGWPSHTNSLDFAVDFHGRPFNNKLPLEGRLHENGLGAGRPQFEEHLHPFRRKNKMQRPGAKRATEPDKPYLQFWTWWGRFYVDVESEEDRFIQIPASVGKGLKHYAILDRHRDFAGTILLDEKWKETHRADIPQEFIALSDAREFDESEYGYWNLYTEEHQDVVPWQLYNVLMIVRDDPNKEPDAQGENVAYRRGLGKVYKVAFEHACAGGEGDVQRKPLWKEVILG